MSENTKTTRLLYLDYLRILATLAVIMIHVAATGWYRTDVNTWDWGIFNFYDSIVRWGIPAFIMISGTLFLGRDDISVKKIYNRYALRMVIAFCVWAMIYYLFSGESILSQLKALFRTDCVGRWTDIIDGRYHLWFVPMITGIYLCLPIIRQIVKNEKVSRYFLILSFVVWILIPQMVTMIGIWGSPNVIAVTNALYLKLDAMNLSFLMNNIFYFVLGYEVSKRKFNRKTRGVIYVLGLFGFAFTILMDWYVAIRNQAPCEVFYSPVSVNVMLEAVALFELFKNIPFKNGRIGKTVSLLSKWSFGAYLVHLLVLDQLLTRGFTPLSFAPVIAAPLLVVTVFLISTAISAGIHYIPVLKKYIV